MQFHYLQNFLPFYFQFLFLKPLLSPAIIRIFYQHDNTLGLTRNVYVHFYSSRISASKTFKMMLFLIIVSVALFVFYKYLAKNHDFFKKVGVKSMQPVLLLGNTGSLLFKKVSMGKGILLLYNAFPNEK